MEQQRNTHTPNCFCPSRPTLKLKLKDMFDFEKLTVYKKAEAFNQEANRFLQKHNIDRNTYDQLRRAAFSIMLNIAEGSGRFTDKDKRNFYVISRGSVFEWMAHIYAFQC